MLGLEFLINSDVGGRGIWRVFTEYVQKEPEFLNMASKELLENFDNVLILTGFPIPPQEIGETDGPLGAIAIYLGVEEMGGRAEIASDKTTERAIRSLGFKTSKGNVEGRSLIIAIETPGRAKDGRRYNMKGLEVKWEGLDSKVEEARKIGIPTIGIGDGGNEIGMGKVYGLIKKHVPLGEKIGSVVETDHLIISAVSNWGAYGMLAYCSKATGRDLMRDFDQSETLKEIVDNGLIDGVKKERTLSVDGIGIDFHQKILEAIKAFYLDL